MDEYMEFLQDYKDRLDRINNFENYNYIETEVWAVKKYASWVYKDQRYALPLTGSTNIPNDNRQKAWNAVHNFRATLYKIALIKEFKI
jgi:hypothetical protein